MARQGEQDGRDEQAGQDEQAAQDSQGTQGGRSRRGRIVGWAVAAAVVLAGGGVGGYVLSDDLRSGFGLRFDRSDLRGRWGSAEGGELLFAPNGDFTAYNISLAPACDAPGSGLSPERRVSGTGRWTWSNGADIAFRPAGDGFRPCTIRVSRQGGKWFRFTQDAGTGEKYGRESHRMPRQ